MKVSLNLIQFVAKTYNTGDDPYSFGVDAIIERIGLQLGAVEEVIRTGDKYDKIVVAEVITCEKHPNADKLSLCTIDDGGNTPDVNRDENGHVQVVCGAPNVKSGLIVAWIPPGATVPSSLDKEPFVLEARELRGKVSNGMIASPRELGISDEHEGILEIRAEDVGKELTKPGTPFKKLYGLDDVIIDCENKMFTHRPDCFGVLGVAREISGIFGKSYSSPDWYKTPLKHTVETDLPLNIENEIPDKVPRFTVQAMSDIAIKDSPIWLQRYLNNIGSKSINNIVDLTNFFMTETGQPLHAFDYDKLKKYSGENVVLKARFATEGEEIELLGGKKIKLSDADMVIATDKKAVALAGVMGGIETEVDENTKNIVIECANFDMYAIRRTSMRHGLFTDAVTRFNKGQSPLQNDRVLAKMVEDIIILAGGKVASEMLDLTSFDLKADNLNKVEVTSDFINERLGSDLKPSDMKKLLENVEFTVSVQGTTLYITVPFWRMDIEIGEDIVEEIGRLYGYQNLPVVLPERSSKPTTKNMIREFSQELRHKLVMAGANEVLTYSFVHGDLLRNTGTDPEKWAYHLRNALSPDLQYYRTSLVPSLLAKVHGNLKAHAGSDNNEFALFEIGKAHVKGHNEEDEKDLPKQMRRIAFVVAADAKTAKKYQGSAYYLAKKYLDLVTDGQARFVELDNTDYPITSTYQKGRSAMVMLGGREQIMGVIGEFNSKAKKSLKLPDYCAGFELDVDLLKDNLIPNEYKKLFQFPSVSQDITFELPNKTSWASVSDAVYGSMSLICEKNSYEFNVAPLDIYHEEKSHKNRISFRVTITHHDKTLKSAEVTKLLDKLSEAVGEKLQAVRI